MVAEHGRPRVAERIVDVLVPPIMEEIAKVVKTALQEQISERIRKQIMDVCMLQVVEQVTEVLETSSRDQTLQCTAEQILDVPAPEMVNQLVAVLKTLSQDRIQQRNVERIVDVPVPQAVEELAEVFKVYSRDRIQQRSVEQTIDARDASLAEMIVHVPVIQTPEKAQQVVNTSVQHVVDTVEVEMPKIIEQTVQKPIIQEKTKQVTKHIDVPRVQFLDKADDMPVVVQRQVSMAQTVQKTMEVPPSQFIYKVVDTPVVAQLRQTDQVVDAPVVSVAQAPHVPCSGAVQTVQKTAETSDSLGIAPEHQVAETAKIPQLLSDAQCSQVQAVEQTVEIPLLQIVKKTVEIPEIQTVRGTQTSESLGTAPARQVIEIEAPLPTESASSIFPVVVGEHVALAPAVTHGHAAPVVVYMTPAPIVACAAPVTTMTAAPTVFPTATMRGDCSQEMTAAGSYRYSRTSCAFCCGVDTPCDMPVAMPRQTPVIQRAQKMVGTTSIQFIDRVVDVPVMAQRPVPSVQRVQKIVEIPQIQCRRDRSVPQIAEQIVEAPRIVPREFILSPCKDDTDGDHRLAPQKRKLSIEIESAESADGRSDSERGLVQEGESTLEVDETREKSAADEGKDLDLLPVAPNMEAGGSHLQATAEEERIVDWTQDLREIRRMVEFLVRRERKLDVKADVAVRRLARLEREHSQQEDEEREASLPDALADRTKVVKLVVDKWFVDKGFGFGKVPTGEVIFIHASVVHGAEVLMIGTDAWVQVVRDDARAQGGYRACKAWGHAAWKEERDKERATKVTEQVRRAAALTAELAAQSEKEVSEVCSHPPGLRDDAAVVAPQSTCSLSHVASNPLQTSQGFLSFSGKFRERQPRSDTRAQEASALADETLKFFIKATDKDETANRSRFTGMKLENLRRERDRWKTRAEEKQRLQDKKDEAWEFFRRQGGMRTRTREDFEQQFKQKVHASGLYRASQEEQERQLQEWTEELQKLAQKQERKLEARERTEMGQEDANSQWRRSWDKALEQAALSPYLSAAH